MRTVTLIAAFRIRPPFLVVLCAYLTKALGGGTYRRRVGTYSASASARDQPTDVGTKKPTDGRQPQMQ